MNKMREIQKRILGGESETLDFKQAITSAVKIAKTIVSFANHKGGTLLIGVRDNKSIAGINPEEEKHMLLLAAQFYCRPEVELLMQEHEIDGKTILEAMIPEGKGKKPYYAKGEDEKWWVYIRVKDKSVLASKIVMDVLKREDSNRGTLIQFTHNEKTLLEYLTKHERITLKEFCKLVNISRWRASKILVNLVSAGVVRSHTTEKMEYYTLA